MAQTPHPCALDGLWLGRAGDKQGVGMWLNIETPNGAMRFLKFQ